MTPLYATTAGIWKLRRPLEAAGWSLRLGVPPAGAWIAVWGKGPRAWRGEALARRTGGQLLRIEDAPLRSLFPGRSGEPPLGLWLDRRGAHYDATAPSDIEHMLAHDPLDDGDLLRRTRGLVARMQDCHIGKFAACDPALDLPEPGFVLIIDQVRGDASAPDPAAFDRMLAAAKADHPDARIVIKTHPESRLGHRPGHFHPEQGDLITTPVSPWALMARARAVYCVSSGMGFEAILAGHRPQVFGAPFYAGWGLTEDRGDIALPRRGRTLTADQLAAAALIGMSHWFDPATYQPTTAERTVETLAARARAWREDRQGWTVLGASRWKHSWMRRHFGGHGPVQFRTTNQDRPTMAWGLRAKAPWSVEDGFLRSRGLGAGLVPPQSLCLDRGGLHYDPEAETALERLIAASPTLPKPALQRARALRERIVADGHSKYGLNSDGPALPQGNWHLVLGQVADDASVRLGAPGLTDRDLMERARDELPAGARLAFKPHPDVVAGFRDGCPGAETMADHVVPTGGLPSLLSQVAHVWTLTSLGGFEALLHGRTVTCLGRPFYAGWGLTRDLGPPCPRRRDGITLDGLCHAALIDYPRYWDPRTGHPCAVEDLLDALDGMPANPGHWPRLRGAIARRLR